jgi:hypothetical protein
MAIGFLLLAGLYFTPLIVGVIRKVPNIGSILVINVFLGWSLIGWIVALAMASRSIPSSRVLTIVHQSAVPPTAAVQSFPSTAVTLVEDARYW